MGRLLLIGFGLFAVFLLATGSLFGQRKKDASLKGTLAPNEQFTDANRKGLSAASSFPHGAQRKAGGSYKLRSIGSSIHKKIGRDFVAAPTGFHPATHTV